MSEKHLACAIERLSRFSVVLVTELIGDAHFLLAAKFGWDIELDAHSARGGTKVDSSALQEFASEPATIALLHERHDLDLRLHAHARRLMCRDLAEARAKQAARAAAAARERQFALEREVVEAAEEARLKQMQLEQARTASRRRRAGR